ncbi:MAG: hypothetical protein QXV85_09885 [Candidatus Bathyarchaeia archaeon]
MFLWGRHRGKRTERQTVPVPFPKKMTNLRTVSGENSFGRRLASKSVHDIMDGSQDLDASTGESGALGFVEENIY